MITHTIDKQHGFPVSQWDLSTYIDVKIELTSKEAKVPVYSSDGAAGFDFFAIHDEIIEVGKPKVIDTGVKIEVPRGFVLMLFSRSGHGFKNSVRLGNSVGILDSDYRGNVAFLLAKDPNDNDHHFLEVFKGDRIGQGIILPYPSVRFEVAETLSPTKRGEGGMGSTGR
jgi:dUTP pyrophosphatase